LLPFLLRRALHTVPTLFGLLIVTFLLIRIVPADPAAALAGDNATPRQIENIRHQYGFDRPILEQLVLYLEQVLRFNFGESQYSHRPVGMDIRQRLPATLELTAAALLIATGLGIPLGVIAGVYHNRWPDFLLRVISITGVAVAAFWFAIMLQLLFAMQLEWLPLRGRLGDGIVPAPRSDRVANPRQSSRRPLGRVVGCIAPSSPAGRHIVARRSGHDHPLHPSRCARDDAKGFRSLRTGGWVSAPPADLDYVLRNSVTAAVTQIGLLFGALIAGAVVVEAIFDWPGIGNYAVLAILTADYKVMLAVTLLIGVIYTVVNILTDLVHGLLDPRLWEQL